LSKLYYLSVFFGQLLVKIDGCELSKVEDLLRVDVQFLSIGLDKLHQRQRYILDIRERNVKRFTGFNCFHKDPFLELFLLIC